MVMKVIYVNFYIIRRIPCIKNLTKCQAYHLEELLGPVPVADELLQSFRPVLLRPNEPVLLRRRGADYNRRFPILP